MDSPLAGIVGTSRSGSTWLGSIVGSHPRVAYRFEPFHRLKGVERIREARQLIASDSVDSDQLGDVYRLLLEADPVTEKPPFFRRDYQMRLQSGRWLLWPLARESAIAAKLFRWLYSPKDQPMVVFKEVNMEQVVGPLANAGVPVVYLVRHPCAVVWSHLKGQERHLMQDGREQRLARRLAKADPALHDRLAGHMDSLSKAQKRAVLWRIAVDQVWNLAAGQDRILWLVYEDLCLNPVDQSRRVLEHLGLDLVHQVDSFIRESISPRRMTRLRRGELFASSYFSVFRNPLESMSYWRRQMPDEDRDQVLEIVRDSPAYAHGARNGPWSEDAQANGQPEAVAG